MERMIRFAGLVFLMEVAAAIAIKLGGGKPFGSMSGWSGLGLLVGLVLFAVIIGGVTYTIVHGNFDKETEWGITAGIVLSVIIMIGLFGAVGLEWLKNLKEIFKSGGLWWPITILIACIIAWVVKLGRR